MSDLTQHTVMIVEDEVVNVDILLETLGEEYEIVVALSGEDALEDAVSVMPNLILLDIRMPGMDGYEVCRKLKGDERTRDIPVIFVTALDDAGDRDMGLELGAVDYITKPFDPAQVREKVRNCLEDRPEKEIHV